jgi:SNF2 family DNA or RNA helicase
MPTKSKLPRLSSADLYPYQRRMIDHILENDFCALWVDMGLGKTVASLTAAKRMLEELEAWNILVVAPLRVARKTWTDEIDVWSQLTGLTTSKIIGTEKQRLRAAKTKANIHLINRENFTWLHDHFVENHKGRWRRTAKWPWDTVIIDESSSFKNQDSERYKSMRRMRKYIRRMVQLTGTPAPNGLEDLWAQAYLLDHGQRLGSSLTAFRRRWFEPPDLMTGQRRWTPKDHGESQIHTQMKDIAMTLRAEDYLELPPVMYNWVRVDLSPKEMAKYRKLQRDYVLELKGKIITAANAGVLWGKLIQAANGAIYTEHPAWETFHRAKLDRLLELEDTIPDKMIIVYNYVPDLKRMTEAFDKAGVNWRLLKTEQDEDDWNAGKIDRLILHPASAGHGTNLHKSGAETIIWYGLTANYEYYDQTNARLAGGHRRVGKNVVIHHIVADGTIDEVVRGALRWKEGTQDRLLEATKRIISDA